MSFCSISPAVLAFLFAMAPLSFAQHENGRAAKQVEDSRTQMSAPDKNDPSGSNSGEHGSGESDSEENESNEGDSEKRDSNESGSKEHDSNESNSNREKSLWQKTQEKGKNLLKAGEREAEKVSENFGGTRTRREQSRHQILGTYSLLDTWIPSKWGASYAFTPSPRGSWEIEYLRGTLSIPFIIEDFGKITDQRLSVFYRSYSDRNSFSFLYGINYSSFKAQLGIDYLSTVSGGNVGQVDLVAIETLGLTWGVGNRWQLNNNVLIGLDWFTIYIPVITLESQADFLSANASEKRKEEIRDALDVIERIPTFAALKFQLGIAF